LQQGPLWRISERTYNTHCHGRVAIGGVVGFAVTGLYFACTPYAKWKKRKSHTDRKELRYFLYTMMN
jgi:hypothetical protein